MDVAAIVNEMVKDFIRGCSLLMPYVIHLVATKGIETIASIVHSKIVIVQLGSWQGERNP
jgi:hypothetical protein